MAKRIPKPKVKRRYTDQEKAAALTALDANGGNALHTAAQIGIPHTTLHYWDNGGIHEEVAKIRNGKHGKLSDGLEEIAWLLVGILPEKLLEAPANVLAVALGIIVDKIQVLR